MLEICPFYQMHPCMSPSGDAYKLKTTFSHLDKNSREYPKLFAQVPTRRLHSCKQVKRAASSCQIYKPA